MGSPRPWVALFLLLVMPCAATVGQEPGTAGALKLEPTEGGQISVGTFEVYEDRILKTGRTLSLDVVVLHATGPDPAPDPVLVLAGGPGGNAAGGARSHRDSWIRQRRDIVLVSQRGTGGSMPLRCALPGNDDNLQGYLDPLFQPEAFRRALAELSRKADLRCYSTPFAMDDLNDVRRALGYERINLMGGSYGTRAALVYMRRHPETVRTAVLNGVAPLEFVNPLYHAWAAQQGLERLFEEVERTPVARAAYPHLREEFDVVLQRLEAEPAEVTVTHPATGEETTVTLGRAAFAEALRVLMYYMGTNRDVPYLIHRAYQGDYRPFAERGIASNRSIRNYLAMGMLLCVTCAEDLDRIQPEWIPRLTEDTFLGPDRVLQQRSVCEFWPRSPLSDDFGDPVTVDVPTLILSGTHDPVTPPEFGQITAGNLPRSLHLIVSGAHGVGGPCIRSIQEQFLESGSVDGLDTFCVEDMRLAPLKLPAGEE